ncbi:MAG: hypothetical protein IKJ87_04950 [Ruminococcus sp.]|nr:hypothetical protein [Ruminococcus sp.]
MDYNYNSENSVSGVEPARKRKGAVIGGITAGVLVVAVGGGVAAYNFSDLVKNQVKLRISKPDDYYTWVTEKNTSETAAQLAESYRTYLDMQKDGQSAKTDVIFDLSDEATEMLSSVLAESDMENMGALNNLEQVKLTVDAKVKDSAVSGNILAAINEKEVISLDMAADYNAMDVFFRIPGLSDQWMTAVNGDDMVEGEVTVTASPLLTSITDMSEIITPEELESLIIKYSDLYNSYVSDVTIEKKEEVTISDITVNYTVAEMTLDSAKMEEIENGFQNAVKEDELLKEIIVDRLKAMTAEEYEESLSDSDEAADEEIIGESDEPQSLVIRTYIDAKGGIRGISASNPENSGDEVHFVIGQDEAEIRAEFIALEESEETLRMDIALTEKDEKTYDGTVSVVSDGEEISAEISDLTVVNEKKGYMSGNISAKIDEQTFALSLSADDNSQTASCDVVIEGTNYGKLTITSVDEKGAEITLPDKAEAFDINGEDVDFPSEYVDQDKMTAFAKEVLMNIGLDEETSDELAAEFGDSIYNSYYSEDDWGYDDELTFEGEIDFDDAEFDIDDEDLFWETATEADDPYADDIVYAEHNDAYLFVMDNTYMASYTGYEDTLSYNAKVAEVKDNGTYTVSVTADTEGYKNASDGEMPEGIAVLGVELYGDKNFEDSDITVKSVKIDGKEYKLATEPAIEKGDGYFSISLYTCDDLAWDDTVNAIDLSSVGEWTDIEITFEVK